MWVKVTNAIEGLKKTWGKMYKLLQCLGGANKSLLTAVGNTGHYLTVHAYNTTLFNMCRE
jgi:hypothetical protein